MEFLIELILDLLFEGALDASQSRRVPRPIRYILIAFIVLLCVAVIGLFFFLGIIIMSETVLGGTAIIIFAVAFTVLCILKSRKIYYSKRNRE